MHKFGVSEWCNCNRILIFGLLFEFMIGFIMWNGVRFEFYWLSNNGDCCVCVCWILESLYGIWVWESGIVILWDFALKLALLSELWLVMFEVPSSQSLVFELEVLLLLKSLNKDALINFFFFFLNLLTKMWNLLPLFWDMVKQGIMHSWLD